MKNDNHFFNLSAKVFFVQTKQVNDWRINQQNKLFFLPDISKLLFISILFSVQSKRHHCLQILVECFFAESALAETHRHDVILYALLMQLATLHSLNKRTFTIKRIKAQIPTKNKPIQFHALLSLYYSFEKVATLTSS